ncbi:hypothetical protein LJB99_04010 [Deltaproteobacteria bacterium OttesenSCG-928-K17]|nr:hypothetical protein [Deltaproteobacteria bacterium OttesenSCG-928-K17]
MSKAPDSLAGRLPDQQRLNQMAGDDRRRKKPMGRLFWFMFSLLFIAACVLVIVLFGSLVKSGVEAITTAPPAKTSAPPAGTSAGESPATGQTPPETESVDQAAPGENEAPGLVTENAVKPQPKTIGQTDIYLDEDGVWRNLNREDPSEAPARAKNKTAAAPGSGQSPAARPDDLSALLAPFLNGGTGDANGAQAMDLISTGLGLITGGGLDSLFDQSGGSGPGGLVGLGEILGGLSGGGDFFDQILGDTGRRISTGAGRPEGALAPNDPLHEIRRKMEAQRLESEKRTREIRAKLKSYEPPKDRINNFDGFEPFNPEDAKRITSDWEYFKDPR